MRVIVTAIFFATSLFAQVDGRVLADHSGEPVATAELRFHKAGMRELAADLETAPDGRFRADVPPGDYTVEVVKANHINTSVKLRVPATGVVVRLVRYAVIAGTVRDAEGKPVAGRLLMGGGRTAGSARVSVLTRSDDTAPWKAIRTEPVTEQGTYRIYDLKPGRYAVGLWWNGLAVGSGAQLFPTNTNPRMFDANGGEDFRNIDFTVNSGAAFSVKGRVEGADSKTRYSISLGLPDRPALPVGSVWTEDDGSFALDKVPVGTYDLLVGGPTRGYTAFDAVLQPEPKFGRTRIQVIGQNLEGVVVAVTSARSVDVVLRGGAPGCPKTATVTASNLEPWGIMENPNGQANFEKPITVRGLAPSNYVFSLTGLSPGCFLANPQTVDLNREHSGPVELTLVPSGSIRGVLRGGNPKDYTLVLITAGSKESVSPQLAFPDSEGRFEFLNLRPGRYSIAAQPAAGDPRRRWMQQPAQMITVEVPPGTPTELDLPLPKGGAQ